MKDKGETHSADMLDADVDAELARLATLPLVAYERERQASASRLGMRASALDKVVKHLGADGGSRLQGRELKLSLPEPWDAPVDGAMLLSEMTVTVLRYVVMEEGAAEAVALWVLHAHTLDAFAISPRLGITSPEKRCGKTTCLDVVARLVPRPLTTANITPATIFRVIDRAGPTLLVDEADTFLDRNEEMRGILNSGHRRSAAFATRLVGDDYEPRLFSTWAATAIAMIGRLPDTLEDRAIQVRLRRRRHDEKVAAFRADKTPDLDRLARMATRWASDNMVALTDADPIIPSAITDRAADNWRPLLAIADAAGGEWPARARRVAEKLALTAARDDQSTKIALLADIRTVFLNNQVDRISSADLAAALGAMEERPWSEWKVGLPITQNGLSRMLAEFGISPSGIRIGTATPKGYRLDQFRDAFSRYLPATPD